MANWNDDYAEHGPDGNPHQKSLDVLFANENFFIDAAGPSLTGQFRSFERIVQFARERIVSWLLASVRQSGGTRGPDRQRPTAQPSRRPQQRAC